MTYAPEITENFDRFFRVPPLGGAPVVSLGTDYRGERPPNYREGYVHPPPDGCRKATRFIRLRDRDDTLKSHCEQCPFPECE